MSAEFFKIVPEQSTSEKNRYELRLSDKVPITFRDAYKVNTGKHFNQDLITFVELWDKNKIILLSELIDQPKYIVIHFRTYKLSKSFSSQSIIRIVIQNLIIDLLRALDQQYINEWKQYNVKSLTCIISRELLDWKFTILASHHYTNKHKDENIASVIELIEPIVNKYKMAEGS